MKEPSAPNPTATANEKNRNEVVKLNFELIFYEIITQGYKQLHQSDLA